MSTKEFYKNNGVLGVLTHLAETKLVFEDEYAVLLDAVTAPETTQLRGAEELMLKLMNKTIESYRAEDLFNLMGMLAKVCSQAGRTMRQVKLNGDLAKLPFGPTGRARARWKTRYFRLADQGITYFAKQGDSKPKGQLILAPNTYIRDATFSGRSHCFDIITQNGTLSISAKSESEKELWVCGLARVIHAARASAAAAENVAAPSFSLASGSLVHINEASAGLPDDAPPKGSSLDAGAARRGSYGGSDYETSDAQKAGHLYKLAIKSRRNWKRRYFVQFRNLLSYYESKNDKPSNAKNDIFLVKNTQIMNGLPDDVDASSLSDNLSVDCCFYVISPERNLTLVLAASSPSERFDWVESLQRGARLGDNLIDTQAPVGQPRNFGALMGASSSHLIPPPPPPPPDASDDDATEIEVIIAKGQRQGSEGTSVGRLLVSQDMTLVALRDRMYRELDAADLPLEFSFLLRLNKVVRMPKAAPKAASDSPLGRSLQHEYTKVSRAQEELLGVDRMVEDDCTLYVMETSASTGGNASGPPNSAVGSESWDAASHAAAAAARSRQQQRQQIDEADSAAQSGGGSSTSSSEASEVEALRAAHERERAKWEKEVRKLRAELADTRNMILNLQRGGAGGAGSSGVKTLSPLETLLSKLQRDGYLEDSVSIKSLSRAYERTFEANDIGAVLLVEGGPYEQLVRRHAGEPEHVRGFLEGVEAVLRAHTISKVRLTQPWWTKKLKDVALLRLDPAGLLAWAKSEPWTEDTEERYAFLMGKMRPGAVTEAHMTLLKPRPSYDDDGDHSESEDEADGDHGSTESSITVETKTEAPRPSPPAFLQFINALGKPGPKADGGKDTKPASFLSSIQGFDKARLAKSGN